MIMILITLVTNTHEVICGQRVGQPNSNMHHIIGRGSTVLHAPARVRAFVFVCMCMFP